jgi:glycosyltransferase involved in cell wall biosynthesis
MSFLESSHPRSEGGPLLLASLSRTYGALGRWRIPRLIIFLPLRSAGRAWLRRAVLRHEFSRTDDVTVVIGARNRADYRLENALRSIRSQTYPADLVRVVVVDYGSESVGASRIANMCTRHGAEYVRVDGIEIWSRSRCLNIGIRHANTKFLLVSDADIVFPPHYLSGCVEVLTASPTSVVGSAMLDLPEESVSILQQSARTGSELPFDSWKSSCRPRHDHVFHPSICATYTAFFRVVRGYDEFYEVWGNEDDDLYRRFWYLGLTPRPLGPESSYMHQWHAESERGREGENAEQVRRNQLYLANAHSILRNDVSWGIPQ